MKLFGRAKLSWNRQERLLSHHGRIPMITWNEMKERLRDEYVPLSHRELLLYQWEQLIQENRSVMEYIRDFDWYLLRWHIPKAERTIISRFISGLREEFQEEYISQRVHTLQQAYHLAQDIEYYKYSLTIGYESNHRSYPLPKPTATQPTQNLIRSHPANPTTQSKVEPILPTISKVRCAFWQDFGHEAIQCPNNNPSQEETREKYGKIE